MVKMTPAATDSPAEPVVCTMLFSRMVERPNARRMLIETTAIGIEAETVSPARSPTYTDTAPNSNPKSAPRMTARTENSVGRSDAGMYVRNSPGGAVELQGFVLTMHLRRSAVAAGLCLSRRARESRMSLRSLTGKRDGGESHFCVMSRASGEAASLEPIKPDGRSLP